MEVAIRVELDGDGRRQPSSNAALAEGKIDDQRRASYHIGDTVVYAMHGLGGIKSILTRTTESKAAALLSDRSGKKSRRSTGAREDASALGLRHALQASEVPQVL